MTRPADFFDTYCSAVATLDPAALLALYADDARVFDAMGPAEYPDKAAWAEEVAEWLGSLKQGSAAVEGVRIAEAGDLAVLTGHVTYGGVLADGEEAEVECRMTVVLRRTGDEWLIAHEHTSVPAEMEDEEHDHDHDAAGQGH